MADKPFRVLLDLTELHIDNLKYVWVNVSPLQLKTISDFKDSILQKLNIGNRDIKIFVKEGLLLDEETIIVLRENDTVKVQYKELCSSASYNLEKQQKKCLKKRNYSECANEEVMDLKRCNIDNNLTKTIAGEISDIVCLKKKKRKLHNSLYTADIIANDGNLVESNDIAQRCEKKNKKQIEMVKIDLNDCDISENLKNAENSIPCVPDTIDSYSDIVKNQNEKDETKPNVSELSIDDGNTDKNCETFLSFMNVDSTEKQIENISSNTVNMESNAVMNELSKSSNNSIDLSEKMSLKTSKNSNKKKRKRRKKRKSAALVPTLALIDACQDMDTDKFVSFENDVEEIKMQQKFNYIAPKVPDNSDSNLILYPNCDSLKRKHVIYSEVLDEPEKNLAKNENFFIHNTKETHSSSNTYIVNQDISAVNAQSFKQHPKVSTPNQPNKCRNPSWHVSLMQNRHSDTNNEPQLLKKEEVQNTVEMQSFVKRNSSNEEKQSYFKCEDPTALNSFPEIGTHIKYKVLELDESYSPVISDYREGRVKRVNHDTEEIEIELLKEVVKPGRVGRFENLKDDENPLPEIIRCDTVQWSALISPKRMS